VDLCISCHAAEVLDPVNLARERNGILFENGCANVALQRGETRRTLMGRSSIAGWGLFAGEKVRAGQILGVSHLNEESNGRNIKEKSLEMRRVKEEDYCTIRRVFHSCLLLTKVPRYPSQSNKQIKLSTRREQPINSAL
jgi:hypothetical protein